MYSVQRSWLSTFQPVYKKKSKIVNRALLLRGICMATSNAVEIYKRRFSINQKLKRSADSTGMPHSVQLPEKSCA